MVGTGQTDIEMSLSSSATDIDGSAITEGVPYVLFVLVAVTSGDDQLSAGSTGITLARTNLVVTLTAEIQAA